MHAALSARRPAHAVCTHRISSRAPWIQPLNGPAQRRGSLVLDSQGSSDDSSGMAVSVAARLPAGSHRTLPGSWHGVADQDLAPVLVEFLHGRLGR